VRIIGAAEDFWRARLTRVDTAGDLDFEWHDDILYRSPRLEDAPDVELWHIEAVRTDDYDTVVRIATYRDRAEAEAAFTRVTEDLAEMTKNQFEDAYLSPSTDPDGAEHHPE